MRQDFETAMWDEVVAFCLYALATGPLRLKEEIQASGCPNADQMKSLPLGRILNQCLTLLFCFFSLPSDRSMMPFVSVFHRKFPAQGKRLHFVPSVFSHTCGALRFFKIDKEFLDSEQASGSTATMCVVKKPKAPGGKHQLLVINAGDSRVLLGKRDGTIVDGGGTDKGAASERGQTLV